MCRLITVHAAITATPHAYFAPRYCYFTGTHFLNLMPGRILEPINHI